MNGLQVFRHAEFGELSLIETDGKTYFPATSCAKTLGYTNPHKAINDHCRYLTKREVPHPQNPGKLITMNFIPEGDLYRLIVHSRLPAAEKFERWVFDEVLPAIRRQGGYGHSHGMQSAIAEAVQAAVSQAMHTMMPYLRQEADEPKKRVRRRVTSLVEQLEPALRLEVDEMLMDPNNSYIDISVHLREQYGVLISKSSIGRYAQRFMDALEAQEESMAKTAEAVGAISKVAEMFGGTPLPPFVTVDRG